MEIIYQQQFYDLRYTANKKCFHLSGEPVLSMTGNNFNVYVFCDSGEFGQKINSDDIVQWPEI